MRSESNRFSGSGPRDRCPDRRSAAVVARCLDFRARVNYRRDTTAAMLEFRSGEGGGMSESGCLEKPEILKWYPA